jgi:small subunit ribosomal protein S1
VRNYTKGEDLETVVLAIDPERERISLGIKQMDRDPFSIYLSQYPKGSIVKGVIAEVDARGATVELEGGVIGQLRASELSRERVEDARTQLKPGQEIEAKFMGTDRKNRVISLSVKAKEAHEEQEVVQSYQQDTGTPGTATTLGELLKEQMTRE